MKHSRKPSFVSSNSAATTSTSTRGNDHTNPSQHRNSTQIPVHSSNTESVYLPNQSNAAVKIQSVYRAHTILSLYRKISAVNTEADHLQRLIQRQDTVDAIRSNELETLGMNEALMKLLLRLDSVPGFDPTVREARRKVSRRIVGLQEILDSLSEANKWWEYNGVMKNWDEVVADMEQTVCKERGGEEMESFSVENLGFRWLQRFLREF